MRPGIKVKLLKFGFKYKASVDPPGSLRFVAALSIFSVVGALVYSIFQSTAEISISAMATEKSAYVAVLHFVLPFCVFYSISTNSVLSRMLIVIYLLILYFATIGGKGVLGELPLEPETRLVVASAILLLVLAWLFRSPKMRLYYALIADKPVPKDLESRASDLLTRNRLSPKNRARVEWLIDNLETLILLGFIFAVFIALMSTA